nr:FHA domain-containing protein [Anaerolineae bacterium]
MTRPLDPDSLQNVLTPVQEGAATYVDDCRLILHLGHTGQLEFQLADGEEITFGRGQSQAIPNLVNLGDEIGWEAGMSRLHATIQRTGNMLFVTDLGSTNGTYVNHRQIPRDIPNLLHDGDILRLGLLDMRVRYLK